MGASTVWAKETFAPTGRPAFRAFFPFYPFCNTVYPERERISGPVGIHTGELDDWTPAGPRVRLAQQLKGSGQDAMVTVYAGAHHGFDNIGALAPLPPERRQRRQLHIPDRKHLGTVSAAYRGREVCPQGGNDCMEPRGYRASAPQCASSTRRVTQVAVRGPFLQKPSLHPDRARYVRCVPSAADRPKPTPRHGPRIWHRLPPCTFGSVHLRVVRVGLRYFRTRHSCTDRRTQEARRPRSLPLHTEPHLYRRADSDPRLGNAVRSIRVGAVCRRRRSVLPNARCRL